MSEARQFDSSGAYLFNRRLSLAGFALLRWPSWASSWGFALTAMGAERRHV